MFMYTKKQRKKINLKSLTIIMVGATICHEIMVIVVDYLDLPPQDQVHNPSEHHYEAVKKEKIQIKAIQNNENIFQNFADIENQKKTNSDPETLLHSLGKKLIIDKQFEFQFSDKNLNRLLFQRNWGSYDRKVQLYKNVSSFFSKNQDVEFPYSYILNAETICTDFQDLFMINILFTKPFDFEIRNKVRNYWGHEQWRKKLGYRVVHILGLSDDPEVNKELAKESEQYNDIIQLNFKDSYNNLTVKTLCTFHWAHYFCPNAKWVMKSDADMTLHIFNLTRIVRNEDSKLKPDQMRFICKGLTSWAHPRRPEGTYGAKKFIVTEAEYPFYKYPYYCQGPLYIMSKNLASSIYKLADKLNPLKMEDIYFTGIVPVMIGGPIFRTGIAKYDRVWIRGHGKLIGSLWQDIQDNEFSNSDALFRRFIL